MGGSTGTGFARFGFDEVPRLRFLYSKEKEKAEAFYRNFADNGDYLVSLQSVLSDLNPGVISEGEVYLPFTVKGYDKSLLRKFSQVGLIFNREDFVGFDLNFYSPVGLEDVVDLDLNEVSEEVLEEFPTSISLSSDYDNFLRVNLLRKGKIVYWDEEQVDVYAYSPKVRDWNTADFPDVFTAVVDRGKQDLRWLSVNVGSSAKAELRARLENIL